MRGSVKMRIHFFSFFHSRFKYILNIWIQNACQTGEFCQTYNRIDIISRVSVNWSETENFRIELSKANSCKKIKKFRRFALASAFCCRTKKRKHRNKNIIELLHIHLHVNIVFRIFYWILSRCCVSRFLSLSFAPALIAKNNRAGRDYMGAFYTLYFRTFLFKFYVICCCSF